MDVRDFVERLKPPQISTGELIVPDGVRIIHSTRSMTILIWELEPAVYRVRWISKDSEVPYKTGGQEVLYEDRRLALPYVVIIAVFVRDPAGRLVLSSSNEAYFRTEPITDRDDELLFPALLNISKFPTFAASERPLAWICTQYTNFRRLSREPDTNKRVRASLKELRSTMLEAGFNYSSEHHELTSYWTLSAAKIPQVADLDRWEQLSRENPLFVLDVKWLAAQWKRKKLTVQRLVDRIVTLAGAEDTPLESSTALAHFVFHNNGQSGGKVA